VREATNNILEGRLARGGSTTGEHGVGVEKLGFATPTFTPDDLAAMNHLREAFNLRGTTRRRLASEEPHPSSAPLCLAHPA
jgi:glycolate oxidase